MLDVLAPYLKLHALTQLLFICGRSKLKRLPSHEILIPYSYAEIQIYYSFQQNVLILLLSILQLGQGHVLPCYVVVFLLWLLIILLSAYIGI